MRWSWVPHEASEALRDLVRQREAAKQDQLRAKHRLTKFLLRTGQRPPLGVKAWTERYVEWVQQVRCTHLAREATLLDCLNEVQHMEEGVKRLEQSIVQVIPLSGRGSSRTRWSPDPVRPRPHSRCLGRPAPVRLEPPGVPYIYLLNLGHLFAFFRTAGLLEGGYFVFRTFPATALGDRGHQFHFELAVPLGKFGIAAPQLLQGLS